ncbi:DUF2946 family protein [Thalassospira sp. TSL5-1]|uniref:DUF2946 family protein n=1 Tax=Thalassospira sp. TSL5-1 TaxID=1544451 RepID=UPI00093ED3C0|nr:DUF2946 family protein [Thalassospira sp. TSL5-1]
MRTNRASSAGTLRETITSLVACVLLINTVLFGFMHAPLAAQTQGQNNYIPILICTSHGIQAIRLPGNAFDDKAPPTTSGQYDSYEAYQCALCGIGLHAITPGTSPEIPAIHRILLSNAVTALHITAHAPDFYPRSGSPRAPPLSPAA